MKLPVLNVKSLPNLYKHCNSIIFLHIDINNEGIQEDATFIKDYLSYIREQMYIATENFFVANIASRVLSQNETFVIFKTNVDKKILNNFVEALFAEVDIYCEQHVFLSYQLSQAMIFLEGSPVKLFRTGKVGDELAISSLPKRNTFIYAHNKKPHGKQLLNLEEYRAQYAKLKKKAIPQKPVKQSNLSTPSNEDEIICEYYI